MTTQAELTSLNRQRSAIKRQLDHLFHGLPRACRSDYWFSDLVSRLSTSLTMIERALYALHTGVHDSTAFERSHNVKARRRRDRQWRDRRDRPVFVCHLRPK